MHYAIVFSSQTGNTQLLAEEIHRTLPAEDCLYFGTPDDKALSADRIYVGFWTDKGLCDAATAAFLKSLHQQEVFLFGTAGFGGQPAYFEKVLARTQDLLPRNCTVIGTYMCQGKMPYSVRERYEKMRQSPSTPPNVDALLENFDRALSHPDAADLCRLRESLL